MNLPSLEGQGAIGLDVETKDPLIKERGSGAHIPEENYICGVAVATEAGFREYLPVAHEPGGNLDKTRVMGWLRHELSRADQPKVGANLLYDLGFLHQEGVQVRGPLYDVQVAEPLLNENRFKYDLDSIAVEYLGEGKVDKELDFHLITQFSDAKNPKKNIWRAHPDQVRAYAIGDVDRPLRIFPKQRVALHEQDLWSLFLMESKLIPVLADMRRRGVRVDVAKAEKMNEEVKRKRSELVDEIKRQTGIEIAKTGMGKEIERVLRHIGISEFPLTPKTQKPSITADFIESVDHPVAEMVLEVRKMDKLSGTFLEGSILEKQHRGRVHCAFNQLRSENGGAVSGRFSSSGPNLQFIPVRTKLGKEIRSIFIPDDGQGWFKLDYSQIEYILMLHDAVTLNLRGAQDMAQKYREDEEADFHQLVADMTGLERGPAKTVNFGLAYGEGVEKLCRSLHLTREDGEALIAQYHRGAPWVRSLLQGCMDKVNRTGEIRTLMKRKRRFDRWEMWKNGEKVLVPHRVPGSRRAFTHAALNARTQGSAADVMKQAMVDIASSGVLDVLGPLQLTVHDELDGSFPKTKEGWRAVEEMQRIMEEVMELSVPLRVDTEGGDNWGGVSKVRDGIRAADGRRIIS